MSPSSPQNITTATTTTVKSGSGILRQIVFNKPVISGVTTIYDNTTASGTKIGTITNPGALLQQQMVIPYNVRFQTGLTIVTSTADDITVCFE